MTGRIFLAGAGFMLAACATPVTAEAPVAPIAAQSEPTAAQREAFGPLADLVGQTWRSEPAAGSESGPADISNWSWDLGGRVIVSRHALVDGSYGGITHIYRNAATGTLDYVYVTSAGFHTTGTFVIGADGSWTTEEAVTGHPTVTRVRSTGQILPDGRMQSRSDYLSADEWSPGRDVIYVPVVAEVPEITGRLAE